MDHTNEVPLETFSFTRRPANPLTISIQPPGPDSPAAPPSPFFAGMNEDINTEPFPEYEEFALSPKEPLYSAHCAIHCDHKVCIHRRRRRHKVFPFCTCLGRPSSSLSSKQQPSKQPTQRPALDVFAFYEKTLSQRDRLRRKTGDTELAIYLTEAHAILNNQCVESIDRALRDDAFMAAMRDAFPGGEIQMAVMAVEHFFDTVTLYFERTVQRAGPRTVKLEQLWNELIVYLWTMLRDWVGLYCSDEVCDRVLIHAGVECMDLADSGAPAAVLGLWHEMLQVLLETLVLRDEEVKNYRPDRTVAWVILGCVLFMVYGLVDG